MGRLGLLRQVYDQVNIGEAVKVEVLDRGKAISARGVEQIEQALEERGLRTVRLTAGEHSLTRRIMKNSGLAKGEAESLALAHGRRWTVIVDDKEARAWARTLNLVYLGTAGVLLEAYGRGLLPFEELEEAVVDLSKVMWLSPAVVAEVLRVARERKT